MQRVVAHGTSICISRRLLTRRVHTLLLRRHGIRRLGHTLALLLLEVGLVLQCLLLIRGHVGLCRCLAAGHSLRRHGLRHGRCRSVLLFGRVDSRLAVNSIGVGGFGSV